MKTENEEVMKWLKCNTKKDYEALTVSPSEMKPELEWYKEVGLRSKKKSALFAVFYKKDIGYHGVCYIPKTWTLTKEKTAELYGHVLSSFNKDLEEFQAA